MKKKERRRKLTVTILSLSLLTVMAGAAVAPALNVIQEYFVEADRAMVQMIISVPALLIALTSLVFPYLCKVFKARTLTLIGLLFYTAGGVAAGLYNSIYMVLLFRGLVGIGAGIIMPMSTGLLSFYYTRDKQDRLMGYSSAMNQMGGVIATLLSGILASISWRASFLVYSMGMFSVVLCVLFLPNERISQQDGKKEIGTFKRYHSFVIAIFLSMFTFFVYPTSFAIEVANDGIIPMRYVAVIMAGMDLVAFVGGLAFVHIRRVMGQKIKYAAPILFLTGYVFLMLDSGWVGTLVGSALVGFANGLSIPFIIASAGKKAGRLAATTVMPLLSLAMYMAQFITPVFLSVGSFHPYMIAAGSAAIFVMWSIKVKDEEQGKDRVVQER